MKKVNDSDRNDELRPEYDLSLLKGGVRGKYAKRFREGTNLVLLSPDVEDHTEDGSQPSGGGYVASRRPTPPPFGEIDR